MTNDYSETGTCALCGGRYADYGHNPAPLGNIGDRCCGTCNTTRVLPERIRRVLNADAAKRTFKPRSGAELTLQQKATQLQCWIDVWDEDGLEPGIDYGPFYLRDADTGYAIWGAGLPLEGIADALDRLERERAGEPNAWKSFGKGWADKYISDHRNPRTNAGEPDRVSGQSQRPTQRRTPMGERKDYAYGTSNYLKADELAGKTARVIISDVEDVEFDKGLKPVLSFEGKRKRLVVNATNFDILCAGISNNTKHWPGHAIVLRGVKTTFKGKLVDSIIVELAQQPKQTPKETGDDFDDGLPADLMP